MQVEDGVKIDVKGMAAARLVIILATVMRVRSLCENRVQFDLVCANSSPVNTEEARGFCRRLSKESTQKENDQRT